HVEQNMQQAAVQPGRAQDGPPAAEAKNRNGTARPEHHQGPCIGRENIQKSSPWPEHVGPRDHEREDIEDHRSPDDKGDKAEISSELAQCWSKAPETRVGSAAHVAAFVVHADERSARRTDHRSGCFTAKHQTPSYSDREVQLKPDLT